MTNYETDQRPFSECLKEFAARLNNGSMYGARPKAADELRVSEATMRGWLSGRPCQNEKSFRRLMTLIE